MGSDKKNWKSAIQELMKGRELAVQLGALLLAEKQTNFDPNSATALTSELMSAFSKAIAALDDGGLKSTAARRKITSQRTAGGHRRRSNPYSCTKRVSKSLDDGHSWRKYGQKEIYNAKYTRSYFRCTHKYDQGCVATRHVQRSEEDPSMYVITYFGDHTCRDPAADLSSYCSEGDSFIIDFAKAASGCQEPAKFSVCKEECREESTVSNHPTPGSSSSGLCFEMPQLGTEEESAKLVEELLGGNDHGDVSSKLQSATDDFGLDFMEGTFEFSDFLSIPDDVFVQRMVE